MKLTAHKLSAHTETNKFTRFQERTYDFTEKINAPRRVLPVTCRTEPPWINTRYLYARWAAGDGNPSGPFRLPQIQATAISEDHSREQRTRRRTASRPTRHPSFISMKYGFLLKCSAYVDSTRILVSGRRYQQLEDSPGLATKTAIGLAI